MDGDLDEIIGQSGGGGSFPAEVDRSAGGGVDVAIDGTGDGNARDAGRGEGDTEAGGDQADHGRPLRGVLDDVGPESAFFAAGEGSVEGQRAHAAGEEDEGFGGEIADAERTSAGQRMAAGQDSDVAFLEDRCEVDGFGGVGIAEESKIDGAVQEGGDLRGGGEFAQAKFDLGIVAAVALDGGGKFGKHDGAGEADGEGAFFAAAEAADLREVVLNFFEGGAGAFGEQLAGQGEFDAAGGAIEETVAEHLFQALDLLAERGLGNSQALGGFAEVQGFGDGQEVAEVAKLDFSGHTFIIYMTTFQILDIVISSAYFGVRKELFMAPATEAIIREFRPGDEAAFRRLNVEWIVRYFGSLERKDEATLSDPQGSILDGGGRIFLAERDGQAIGCCALRAIGAGEFEVSKMGVTASCQRGGVGRRLLEKVIAEARAMGARRLYLETNQKLTGAIRMYESFGFQHLPPERVTPSPYARANVYMELYLSRSRVSGGRRTDKPPSR